MGSLDFPILEPWEEIEKDEDRFVIELKKEINSKHILYAFDVVAIANRIDNDDVLFHINNSNGQYAVVHLTWTGKQEENETWPVTKIYSDIEQWRCHCMLLDHEKY